MTATAEVTPGAAAPPALSRGRVNAVFGAVLLGMLLAALDQTIVGTALPTIVGDLGGAGHLSWVVTSYLLAETIMTVVVGKLGDLFGRKLMFQLSVVVFGIGSFCAGFADSMIWLIVWRAVQGLGGGGLMVTSTALIADVVPLRERGKYQGVLGSVFGVVTVAGPMLGGFFVDHLSWRWAFYVNIPLVVVVLAVASSAMPNARAAVKPVIDYLGILLIGLAATGLTLVTSWGGTQYAWGSPVIIGMALGSVLLLAAFVFVELRAQEPMLPMRLFRNPVFTVGGIMSFVVGFAMLGALSYLPTYMQYVQGTSATTSGVRLLPMVLALLVASIAAGNAVSRTGRYKIFPLVGAAGMTIGLYLLSRLDTDTGFWEASAYMAVLGLGIGLGMQVLTIAVQNTRRLRRPRRRDLGRDVPAFDRQLVRRGDLRHGVRQPADPQAGRAAGAAGGRPAGAAGAHGVARAAGDGVSPGDPGVQRLPARRVPRGGAGRPGGVRVGVLPEGDPAARHGPRSRPRPR